MKKIQDLQLSAVCVGPRGERKTGFQTTLLVHTMICKAVLTMIMAQSRRYMNCPQRKSLSLPVTYKSLIN